MAVSVILGMTLVLITSVGLPLVFFVTSIEDTSDTITDEKVIVKKIMEKTEYEKLFLM